MTKKEHNKLIEMQKNHPVTNDKVLEALWEIGDLAEIRHCCCYQDMLTEIIISAEIDNTNKSRALHIFEQWAYKRGRADERRDTGSILRISWFEG